MIQERLKYLRKELKLTQKELAEKLELNQQTYTNYEYGKRDIPNIILEKIASLFDINLNWLITGMGRMKNESISTKTPLFHTYDFFNDFDKLLPFIANPVAHLIVESTPSSNYNLPCIVLESIDSGEWYVFERGRISIQGTGGGYNNLLILLSKLKKNNISLGKWTLSQKMISDFESGQILWPEVKKNAVPLFSFISNQDDWQSIIKYFKEILIKEYIVEEKK